MSKENVIDYALSDLGFTRVLTGIRHGAVN